MINLISKSPDKCIEQIGKDAYALHCGLLTQPFSGYDVRKATRWALDNGCYLPGYNPKAILAQLEKWQGVTGCIFAALPDVVRNHAASSLLSFEWLDTFHHYGYPPAWILQDGVTVRDVPYNEIAAVFIGGDDAFKYSRVVFDIVQEAHTRGLWVHHGRVGGKRRFDYSRDILKCHSFDSTGFSIHPPKIKEFIAYQQIRQLTFLETAA